MTTKPPGQHKVPATLNAAATPPGLARNDSIDPNSLQRPVRRTFSPKSTNRSLQDSGGMTATGSSVNSSLSSINSGVGFNHESVKFSAKNFVTSNDVGTSLESHYKLGDLIGEGGFGEVYECEHLATGEIRAVKVMEKSSTKQSINDEIVKEYNILKELDHPKYVIFCICFFFSMPSFIFHVFQPYNRTDLMLVLVL